MDLRLRLVGFNEFFVFCFDRIIGDRITERTIQIGFRDQAALKGCDLCFDFLVISQTGFATGIHQQALIDFAGQKVGLKHVKRELAILLRQALLGCADF